MSSLTTKIDQVKSSTDGYVVMVDGRGEVADAATIVNDLNLLTSTEIVGLIDSVLLIDDGGGANNEHLLTPMPSTSDPDGRNKINDAGLTSVATCTNVGAAAVGASNRIVSVARPTTGAGSGPTLFNTQFVDDDLSSDPTIIVATVYGAYDQVCNSTGSSVIASPHSYIKHSVGGHNNIIGGSTLLISGTSTRCLQLAGLCTVIHDGNFTTAINCDQTTLNGASRTTAIGCFGGTVITSIDSLHVAATGTTISGTKSLTVGNVTFSGTYSVAAGASVIHSGTCGLSVGNGVTNAKNNATVFGSNTAALQDNSLNIGGVQISTKGDATVCVPVDGVLSTGSGQTLSLIQFPAGCNVAGICEVSLIGKVVGENKIIAWSNTIAFRNNADTINLIDATGSGANLYRSVDLSDSGLTWAAGNAGLIRIAANATLLRIVTPQFTDASTSVKWVASAKITLTREDVIT